MRLEYSEEKVVSAEEIEKAFKEKHNGNSHLNTGQRGAFIDGARWMHDYAGQSDAVELKSQYIVDAYVQGAISENFGASEQEINKMVVNANIYWNNHFSGLKDLNL
jgi:hypothetical protein